jgi:hypothetical protein
VLQHMAFVWRQVASVRPLFLLRYFYFGEFSLDRGNYSRVLRLA